jgi:hypothetical protein
MSNSIHPSIKAHIRKREEGEDEDEEEKEKERNSKK